MALLEMSHDLWGTRSANRSHPRTVCFGHSVGVLPTNLPLSLFNRPRPDKARRLLTRIEAALWDPEHGPPFY